MRSQDELIPPCFRPAPPVAPDGFGRVEGLVVFFAALLALGTSIWGLWGHWLVLILFALGSGTFSILYATRLCRRCEKSCPFRVPGSFWKRKSRSSSERPESEEEVSD